MTALDSLCDIDRTHLGRAAPARCAGAATLVRRTLWFNKLPPNFAAVTLQKCPPEGPVARSPAARVARCVLEIWSDHAARPITHRVRPAA
jgi:hypothetical protein